MKITFFAILFYLLIVIEFCIGKTTFYCKSNFGLIEESLFNTYESFATKPSALIIQISNLKIEDKDIKLTDSIITIKFSKNNDIVIVSNTGAKIGFQFMVINNAGTAFNSFILINVYNRSSPNSQWNKIEDNNLLSLNETYSATGTCNIQNLVGTISFLYSIAVKK